MQNPWGSKMIHPLRTTSNWILAIMMVSILCLSTVPTVEAATGNLKVYVRDEDGDYVSGAEVLRYTTSWSYLDRRNTGSSGYAYWSGITRDRYHLEIYNDGQFWGNLYNVNMGSGTTTKYFTRDMPYVYTAPTVSKNPAEPGDRVTFNTGELPFHKVLQDSGLVGQKVSKRWYIVIVSSFRKDHSREVLEGTQLTR